jgi:hypothetical protein
MKSRVWPMCGPYSMPLSSRRPLVHRYIRTFCSLRRRHPLYQNSTRIRCSHHSLVDERVDQLHHRATHFSCRHFTRPNSTGIRMYNRHHRRHSMTLIDSRIHCRVRQSNRDERVDKRRDSDCEQHFILIWNHARLRSTLIAPLPCLMYCQIYTILDCFYFTPACFSDRSRDIVCTRDHVVRSY